MYTQYLGPWAMARAQMAQGGGVSDLPLLLTLTLAFNLTLTSTLTLCHHGLRPAGVQLTLM